MKYTEKLLELHDEVVGKLRGKISTSYSRSNYLNNTRCLRLPELFEKIKTPQGIVIEEIVSHGMIDNTGMSWNFSLLDTYQLCRLTDVLFVKD